MSVINESADLFLYENAAIIFAKTLFKRTAREGIGKRHTVIIGPKEQNGRNLKQISLVVTSMSLGRSEVPKAGYNK